MVTNHAFLANCQKSQNDKFQAMSERFLIEVILMCLTGTN